MTSKFFVIYDGEDCVEIVKAPSAPPNTLSGPFPSYDEAVCHLWHWDYRRGGPLSIVGRRAVWRECKTALEKIARGHVGPHPARQTARA